MIIKILYLFVFYFVLFAVSSLYILSSFPLTLNKEATNFFKNYILDLGNLIYQKAFSNIYINGKYEKSDKVDIVISNHTNTIDFLLNVIISNNFDNRTKNYLIKRATSYMPIIGFICSAGTDILINRNLEEDKQIIINKVKKIKEGTIYIMPEGTRFTPEKQKKAQEYSIKNNLPVFKNTLYPKMKGLWIIINILKKENKLGNIIDLTSSIENFKGKKAYLPELMKQNMGNTYNVIKTYQIPKDNSLENYDDFKKWFLEIWKEKDKTLENIENYKFERLPIKISFLYVFSLILLTGLFVFANVVTKYKFGLYSIILFYIITFLRNIKETIKG